MYYDLTDEELQTWLLAESISDAAILGSEEDWQATQTFRAEVRDSIAWRQCSITDEELLDI